MTLDHKVLNLILEPTFLKQNISGKVNKRSNINVFTSFQGNYCLNVQSSYVIYTHISLKICFILSLE